MSITSAQQLIQNSIGGNGGFGVGGLAGLGDASSRGIFAQSVANSPVNQRIWGNMIPQSMANSPINQALINGGGFPGTSIPSFAGNPAVTALTGAEAAPVLSGAARSAASGVADLTPYANQITEAGLAGNIGETATKLGGIKGIIDKLPFANGAAARPGLGLAAVLAGQVGGGLVDKLNIGGENSNPDQFLTGAVKGLGIGGGAALALGLSGPVGWAVLGGGALIGGLMSAQEEGGTTTQRLNKTADKTTQTIQTLAHQYGITGTDLQDIMLQHQAQTSLFIQNKDTKGMDAYVKGLASTLPQEMLQYKQKRDLENQHYSRVLGMQQQFAPMFKSINDQAHTSNQIAYGQSIKAADQLQASDPTLAALIRSNAGQQRGAQDSLLASYAAQIGQAPSAQEAQNYYGVQQAAAQNMTPAF